jgi:hypothetical protein
LLPISRSLCACKKWPVWCCGANVRENSYNSHDCGSSSYIYKYIYLSIYFFIYYIYILHFCNACWFSFPPLLLLVTMHHLQWSRSWRLIDSFQQTWAAPQSLHPWRLVRCVWICLDGYLSPSISQITSITVCVYKYYSLYRYVSRSVVDIIVDILDITKKCVAWGLAMPSLFQIHGLCLHWTKVMDEICWVWNQRLPCHPFTALSQKKYTNII